VADHLKSLDEGTSHPEVLWEEISDWIESAEQELMSIGVLALGRAGK
jgi:hypothetical protein